MNIDIGLNSAQTEEAPTGPKDPRAGPVLPNNEIETERTSVKERFGSRKEIVNMDAVTKTIQELTIPSIIQIPVSYTHLRAHET